MADRISDAGGDTAQGALAAQFAAPHSREQLHTAPSPLGGYQLIEIRIDAKLAHTARRLDALAIPTGAIVAAVATSRQTVAAQPDILIRPGDRLICLTPTSGPDHHVDTNRQHAAAPIESFEGRSS